MAGSIKEQGEIPGEVIFKPFSQVRPEEIVERLDGWIDGDVTQEAEKGLIPSDVWLIGVSGVDIHRKSGEEPDVTIYGLSSGNFEFQETNPETILEGNSVTFVSRVHQISSYESVSWLKLERGGLSLMTRDRQVGQPWPSEVTPNILKAAANIAARPQPIKSA